MGHLQQCKQGVRSMKLGENTPNVNNDMPEKEKNNKNSPGFYCLRRH